MMRFNRLFLSLFGMLLAFSPALLAQQAPKERHDGKLLWELKHDVSPALRTLPVYHGDKNQRSEAEPIRRIPLPAAVLQSAANAAAHDAVHQQTAITPLAATTGLGFEGLGNGQYGFSVASAPPDTNGAVGSTQFVQIVNSSYAVFNKSTGALVAGPFKTNALWSGFGGGCQANDDGDGIVIYDKIANRWVISQFSVTTTPYLECIAVSTTSDATGTYNRYAFQYTNFPDYPKMGVWPDGYYVTYNVFNGNTFVGADACVLNRSAMLNGQTANQICFQQGSSVGGMQPSDLDGATLPPSGSPNYMMVYGSNSLLLYKFHTDFVTTSNSSFTGPTTIPVSAFTALCNGGTCVPQPGTTNQLDSLADRLMFRLAYRNLGNHESLVVNHSVTGGVRWYEIQNPSGTPQVAQQGTFGPDSATRWMGSIAMDKSGDIALGYSKSSSSVSPSVFYTGRVPSDPVGTMETETQIVAGTGSQNGTLHRWGDYSELSIDPVDDCTFWFTTEYMKTTGTFNWNTRIANFKFSTCGGTTSNTTATLSPSSLTFGSQTVGTTSAAQNVTLTNNNASAAITISSIAVTGDFAQTNNCGTSLAASASCTISVTFKPTASGTRSGTLTATDSATNSPQTTALSGTGASGTTSNLIGNGGFENGSTNPAPWTVTAGVIDNSTGEAAHSGSWKAWMDGYGSSHTDTVTQTVSIPSTVASGTLTFWLHIDTAETTTTTAYDTLKVQVLNTSGTVLATLATYSNLNKNTGYVQKSLDVTAYKGQTIQIRFLGTEDTSLQTSFVVDDVALNVQ